MNTIPKGACKIIKVVDRKPNSKFAVFVRVIVEDEAGKQFYFDAAVHHFDLLPKLKEDE